MAALNECSERWMREADLDAKGERAARRTVSGAERRDNREWREIHIKALLCRAGAHTSRWEVGWKAKRIATGVDTPDERTAARPQGWQGVCNQCSEPRSAISDSHGDLKPWHTRVNNT